MPIQSETIIHHHDGADLHGLLVWDDSLPLPHQTLMIAHPWAGRGENELRRSHQLARLGYAAFAIHLYGDGKLGTVYSEQADRDTWQALLHFLEKQQDEKGVQKN